MAHTIKRATVEKTRETLAQLPDKKDAPVKMEQAISEMRDEIQNALDRGYTLSDIQQYLNDSGFDLKLTTLKTYWHRNKPGNTTQSAPATKKKSSGQSRARATKAQASDTDTTIQSGQFREDESDL